MPHLLHIDSSIQGDHSTTRRLTARARDRWLATHPGGTVAYRDLGADPVPHFDAAGGTARHVPLETHTPAQAASWALSLELAAEVAVADVVVLGMPLYNFAAPSAVKAWVDHLIVPGVTFDMATGDGLLTGRELLVISARGGGFGPGTPKEGWDHASAWLGHGLSMTGLEPRFVFADLRWAGLVPATAGLEPLRDASLAAAEAEIDGLWAPARAAACHIPPPSVVVET